MATDMKIAVIVLFALAGVLLVLSLLSSGAQGFLSFDSHRASHACGCG